MMIHSMAVEMDGRLKKGGLEPTGSHWLSGALPRLRPEARGVPVAVRKPAVPGSRSFQPPRPRGPFACRIPLGATSWKALGAPHESGSSVAVVIFTE